MSLDDVGVVKEWRTALAALAETAEPREDCPESDRIWAATAGELPPDELREIVDHTASCTVCAEAWRLAVELTREGDEGTGRDAGQEGREAGDDAEESAGSSAVFWYNWAQVAAMVVVLAGAAFVMRDGAPFSSGGPLEAPPEVVRGAEEVRIVALTPGRAPQLRDDLVLAWEWRPPAPDLVSRVELTWETAERTVPIFEARDLMVPRLRIPAEALAEVPSGARLLWEVTGTRNGEVVVRGSFPLRLQ